MQLISEKEAFSTGLIQTVTLDVTGMKCAGCVRAVEQQLIQQPGVISACVNLVTEVAVVECEADAIDPEALAQTVTHAGFPSQARLPQNWDATSALPKAFDRQEHQRQESQQQFTRLAVALTLLLLSSVGHLGQFVHLTLPGLSNIWFHCGLATLALLGPGRSMAIEGWQGLRRNAPNMNTLVSLGTLTAYLTSVIALLFPHLGWECFFDEPVMLVGFILLGRTLEQQARKRAASAFESLLSLQPNRARLIPSGSQESGAFTEIPVDRVRLGEWLQVLPGDKVPVDGEVMAGQTTIDESMLTGESLPVLKQPGDNVAAGTLNQSGAIALRTTRTGKDTTLAQIIALVEAAQTRKAPIQALADTVAGYFTYGVLAIAALTFLFWYFIGFQIWPQALLSAGHYWAMPMPHLMAHSPLPVHPSPLLLSLKLAIAVLVVACPCALGLATPTAILVGSGIGAERGLLIRGGDVLQRVRSLDTIILDKTGTLTLGTPTVTDCLADPVPQLPGLLQLAASVESSTRHPLAIAIQQQAQQQGLALLPTEDCITQPGFGVAATVKLEPQDAANRIDAVRVILGTQIWLEQQGIELPSATLDRGQALSQEGKTVVFVAVLDPAQTETTPLLLGLIAVLDRLRPDAADTVTALKQLGLHVKMVTGDKWATATAIAQPLGLASADILAEVQPDRKARLISQLQATGQRVAMVGDGINDAPALAQADVGIALQSGTDVAVETAGIILVRDRLADVVESIRLSRATFNKIRQNLFWAFAYNVLGIPLAAGALLPSFGILLSPASAGALMAFSSVSVVTNSLLLYFTFPQKQAPGGVR